MRSESRPLLVALLAGLLLLGGCSSGSDNEPLALESFPDASPSPSPVPDCPLSGVEPINARAVQRPAVAVKVENNPVAYPLSGLEQAELVYEELVEGGQTRFMAIYHCSDATKVGAVRSSRQVDAAIMTPTTQILAAAGGNDIVRDFLAKKDVVLIDEEGSGKAMRRIPRAGVALEHTLFGNTKLLRELGAEEYSEPPPHDQFKFGELSAKSKPARQVSVQFSPQITVNYEWAQDKWLRSERGAPFLANSGEQIGVDNLIVEEHIVNNSTTIFDVAGNPSIEIADVTGSGRAVLFRDGRVVVGKWVRENAKDRVIYQTKGGDELTLKPGTTWVALMPNDKGDLKGLLTYSK